MGFLLAKCWRQVRWPRVNEKVASWMSHLPERAAVLRLSGQYTPPLRDSRMSGGIPITRSRPGFIAHSSGKVYHGPVGHGPDEANKSCNGDHNAESFFVCAGQPLDG